MQSDLLWSYSLVFHSLSIFWHPILALGCLQIEIKSKGGKIRQKNRDSVITYMLLQILIGLSFCRSSPRTLRPLLSGLVVSRQPLQPPTQSWKASLRRASSAKNNKNRVQHFGIVKNHRYSNLTFIII